MDRPGVRRGCAGGVKLGIAGPQARETVGFPDGAAFFGITGLHMFHVLTGVLYLGVIAARIKRFTDEDVEVSGLYWHFVDLVWMFVFPLIYLLSVDFSPH